MPQSARAAVIDSLEMASCYPDTEMEELRSRIAAKELGDGFGKENVITGNGASELIYAMCGALNVKKALVTSPAFKEYEEAVKAAGGEVVYETLSEDKAFAVTESILEKITDDTQLVFLCNPNNPTGCAVEKELLLRAAKRCGETGTYLCMDECFLPFMENEEDFSLKSDIGRLPHLMILKAYTKIYGMAGLRFGYLLSRNEEVLSKIRSTIQPWNISIPAQAAAMAVIDEDGYIEKTKRLIKEEREYLLGELRAMNIEVTGNPAANFIMFREDEKTAGRFLEKGILIRSCDNFTGLDKGYFRIGIRSREENEELIRVWKEIRKEA